MRKLTVRSIRLKCVLETQKFTIIEAYPGGAQDVLHIPRKQKGFDKLKVGLEKLGIIGLNSQMSDHELDAATCAYIRKLCLDGQAVAYEAPNQSIIMPKGNFKKKNKGLLFEPF